MLVLSSLSSSFASIMSTRSSYSVSQLSFNLVKIIQRSTRNISLFESTLATSILHFLITVLLICLFPVVTFALAVLKLIDKLLRSPYKTTIPHEEYTPIVGDTLPFYNDRIQFLVEKFHKLGPIFQTQVHLPLQPTTILSSQVICVANIPPVHVPRSNLQLITYQGHYCHTRPVANHMKEFATKLLHDTSFLIVWETTAKKVINNFLHHLVYEFSFSFADRLNQLCCELISTIFLGMNGLSVPLLEAMNSYLYECQTSNTFVQMNSPAMKAKQTIMHFIRSAVISAEREYLQHPMEDEGRLSMMISLLDEAYEAVTKYEPIHSHTDYEHAQYDLIFIFLVEYCYRNLLHEMRVLVSFIVQNPQGYITQLRYQAMKMKQEQMKLFVPSSVGKPSGSTFPAAQYPEIAWNEVMTNQTEYIQQYLLDCQQKNEDDMRTKSSDSTSSVLHTLPSQVIQGVSNVKTWGDHMTTTFSTFMSSIILPQQHELAEEETESGSSSSREQTPHSSMQEQQEEEIRRAIAASTPLPQVVVHPTTLRTVYPPTPPPSTTVLSRESSREQQYNPHPISMSMQLKKKKEFRFIDNGEEMKESIEDHIHSSANTSSRIPQRMHSSSSEEEEEEGVTHKPFTIPSKSSRAPAGVMKLSSSSSSSAMSTMAYTKEDRKKQEKYHDDMMEYSTLSTSMNEYFHSMKEFIQDVKRHTIYCSLPLQCTLYRCLKTSFIHYQHVSTTTSPFPIKKLYELQEDDYLLLVHNLSPYPPATCAVDTTTTSPHMMTAVTSDDIPIHSTIDHSIVNKEGWLEEAFLGGAGTGEAHPVSIYSSILPESINITGNTTMLSSSQHSESSSSVGGGGLGCFSDLLLTLLADQLVHGYTWEYQPNPLIDHQVWMIPMQDETSYAAAVAAVAAAAAGEHGFVSIPNHAFMVQSFHPEELSAWSLYFHQKERTTGKEEGEEEEEEDEGKDSKAMDSREDEMFSEGVYPEYPVRGGPSRGHRKLYGGSRIPWVMKTSGEE